VKGTTWPGSRLCATELSICFGSDRVRGRTDLEGGLDSHDDRALVVEDGAIVLEKVGEAVDHGCLIFG
jgi:hypothetical protein